MFSGDLHRIGLYTPLWSESNPPTAKEKKFRSPDTAESHVRRKARGPRVTLPSLTRTRSPLLRIPNTFLPGTGARRHTSHHLVYGNFSVNQVERDFIPFRSMLEPSHTANAMGTEAPALNWVSLASPVSSERFTTTRQVGPVVADGVHPSGL